MENRWALILLVLLVFSMILLLARRSRQSHAGSYVDTSQPAWIEAVARARAAVPVLRELVAAREAPVDVKYALQNSAGDTEHVWGELLELADDEFCANLRTPLLRGRLVSSPPFRLPLSALEDWQAELPDGTIRGGFTTQLEIALARRDGRHIPDHIANMEKRFVDG